MSTNKNLQKDKVVKFEMEEAQWLDSVVRPLLPHFIKKPVETLSGTALGRLLHFLVDYFIIAKFIGLRITRSQDTVIMGGKGYRQGVDHGYMVKNVHTTVSKRAWRSVSFKKILPRFEKVEIAKKTFNIGIIIKNNVS